MAIGYLPSQLGQRGSASAKLLLEKAKTKLSEVKSNVGNTIASNPMATVGTSAITGAIVGGVVTGVVASKIKKKAKRKRRTTRKRTTRSPKRSRRKRSAYRRKSRKSRKTPRTAGKRRDTSHKRIRYTKKGQPYVIMASGKARFIKKKSSRSSHKRKGGKY